MCLVDISCWTRLERLASIAPLSSMEVLPALRAAFCALRFDDAGMRNSGASMSTLPAESKRQAWLAEPRRKPGAFDHRAPGERAEFGSAPRMRASSSYTSPTTVIASRSSRPSSCRSCLKSLCSSSRRLWASREASCRLGRPFSTSERSARRPASTLPSCNSSLVTSLAAASKCPSPASSLSPPPSLLLPSELSSPESSLA
mmetsp:Transcript_410/g.1168  ORF Transcript_410/g.1168 Transcript_410/m.1168 type:complete len:201 (+) Transcript_410:1593-2195(+)